MRKRPPQNPLTLITTPPRPGWWQGISHFPLSWDQEDLFPGGGWGSAPQILGENKRRSVADLFALALVCGDGHRFDVFTKWAGLEKPVRPMLLALQDVYSRKILAWRIGLNEKQPN